MREVHATELSDGNTFSTDKNEIGECEHSSKHRVEIADCYDFAKNSLPCSFCDNNALNSSELKRAFVCDKCGATICDAFNVYNSDYDKYSDIGEE
jgi:hypothetical protein